jgi:hypothetical protein
VVDIDSATAKSAMGHHSREISLLNLMCFNMILQMFEYSNFCSQINGQHEAIKCFVKKNVPFLFLALCVAAIRLVE